MNVLFEYRTERNNKCVRICNVIAMLQIVVYLLVENSIFYDNLYIRNCADIAQEVWQ